MVGQALFYGQDQSTLLLDIVASATTSLIGTLPQLLIRSIFVKSKPRKHDSTNKGRRTSSNIQTQTPSVVEKYQEIDKRRRQLYRRMYKLPSYSREIAWCILVVCLFAACFTAIIYGLSFDLEEESIPNEDNPNADLYATDCWTSSLQLRIENALSVDYFNEEYAEREEMNASSYGGSDTGSWLLSLGQSLLWSLILWQPLSYVSFGFIQIFGNDRDLALSHLSCPDRDLHRHLDQDCDVHVEFGNEGVVHHYIFMECLVHS